MKILVRVEKCCGHARCFAVAPEVFKLDEHGYNSTPEIQVPIGMEGLARSGVRACPEHVMKIIDESSTG